MQGFISTLTTNKVHEEKYGSFIEYQFRNDDTLVTTIRVFEDSRGRWRVEEVTATKIINTEAGLSLVQENGGRLLTE